MLAFSGAAADPGSAPLAPRHQRRFRLRLPPEARSVKDAWWSDIQGVLVVIVTGLVMGGVAKARMRKRPATEARKLVPPKSLLVIGLFPIVFFLGIAVISNTVGKNDSTTIWTTLGFIAFAALGVPVVSEYYCARHEVLEDGMLHGSMFGKRGRFAWSQITRMRYNAGMKWFVLDLHSGTRVRISAVLLGLPEFAAAALAHVPRSVIDDATYGILQETAAGNPPSIWQ